MLRNSIVPKEFRKVIKYHVVNIILFDIGVILAVLKYFFELNILDTEELIHYAPFDILLSMRKMSVKERRRCYCLIGRLSHLTLFYEDGEQTHIGKFLRKNYIVYEETGEGQ